MANFNSLKQEIDQNVNTNGQQLITGAILNQTLKDMVDDIDQKKQDTLVAGQNITISGNVISATGGGSGQTYYAGTGITIDQSNVISADFNEVQQKLISGQNIRTVNGEPLLGSGDISIQGTNYTAGDGIDIDASNVISVDPSDFDGFGLTIDANSDLAVYAYDLAGNGLQVDNNNGALEVDPSVVATQSDLSGKQDTLTAGTNISISAQNVISATDTTYSAGNGVEIDGNNEISVKAGSGLGFDANGYLINTGGGGGGTTYTAGDGIEIDQNDAINAKLGNGLQLDQNNNIEVDTTVVATQSDLSGKQDTLTAGTNISISGSTISATDTTYSAGNGLNLNGTTFSIDGTVVATQNDLSSKQDTLTASSGISIDASNNISVKAGTGLAFDANGNLYATGGGGGTTYTAGNGIDISAQDVISVDASDLDGNGLTVDQNGALAVDTTTIQEKLTAGTGITITGNTISATGGGGSGLWSSGTGTNSLLSPQASLTGGTATQTGAISTGYSTDATSMNAFAGGYNTLASGDNSFAYGYETTAGGSYSTALGYGSQSGGSSSFAAGMWCTTGASHSVAMGNSSNTGNNSDAVAIGNHLNTSNNGEAALGEYNKTYTDQLDNSIKTAFTIGNGDSNTRSNSVEIKANDDIYVVGVGNFDGTNSGASGVQTLQDVINNGGGGGTSFTPGDALELDQSDNLNVLYGSGLTLNGNNELEVDPSSISGFLPLQGGVLQDDSAGATDTSLGIVSPGNGEVSINMLVNQDDANCQFTILNNTVREVEPGSGESIIRINVNDNGGSLAGFCDSDFVDDGNGNWVRDCSDSGITFFADAGQGTPAEVNIDAYSYNLSDPGNETSEAKISLTDSRGQIEFNPTGFNDGTYNLSFPSLTQDELIATTSDVSNALSGYLPIVGGTLQDSITPGATETLLDIVAPDSTSAISFSADTLAVMMQMSSDKDDANVADGSTYGVNFDNSGDVDILVKTVNPLDPTDISTTTYTQTFQQKSGTIALLSDISGGGGTTYTAGAGINIDANNEISSTTFKVGTGSDSIMSLNATSATGPDSVAIGYHASAVANNACAFGANASARANGAVAVGGYVNGNYGIAGPGAMINGGTQGYGIAFGYNATVDNNWGVAIGEGTYSKMADEFAIGVYNKYYSSNNNNERVAFSIGNGSSTFNRSNAFEIKANNDIYVVGVGGFDGTNAAAATTLQDAIANAGGGGSSLWAASTGTNSLISPGAAAGVSSDASGNGAITVGYDSIASGDYSFAQGAAATASGDYSFAANNGTAAGDYSAAFGTSGANGDRSFAAGDGSIADAAYSIALGGGNVVYDDSDPNNVINAQYGVAIGDGSIVEGEYGTAIGGALTRGTGSTAIGSGSLTEGMYSFAVGGTANADYSFSFGGNSAAGYSVSFPGTQTNGDYSLAAGEGSITNATNSFAFGGHLTADADYSANFGTYNYSDANILFSVGCGYLDETDPNNPVEVRENAVSIDTNGAIYLKGLGGYTGGSVSGCTDLVSFLNNL